MPYTSNNAGINDIGLFDTQYWSNCHFYICCPLFYNHSIGHMLFISLPFEGYSCAVQDLWAIINNAVAVFSEDGINNAMVYRWHKNRYFIFKLWKCRLARFMTIVHWFVLETGELATLTLNVAGTSGQVVLDNMDYVETRYLMPTLHDSIVSNR